MRFEISLSSKDELRFPIHYNSIVQGMIYNSLSPELAHHLHDIGYTYEKRRFKLFTFSNISGQYRLDRNSSQIVFSSPVRIVIGSPIERFIRELGYSMLTSDGLELGDNHVEVINLKTPPEPEVSPSERIGMLSPVTVYSTLKTVDGRSKTYYYSPFEDEFSRLIEGNLRKKYALIHNKEAGESQTVCIKPIKIDKRSEKILKYKGTVIRAWRGVYSIKGDPEIIRVGYDTGLGSKNSQGFGCFKFIQGGGESDRRNNTNGTDTSG